MSEALLKAIAGKVRPTTVLQEACAKVRAYRLAPEATFEVVLGELFVLASDAFKARNGARIKVQQQAKTIERLESELKLLRSSGSVE